MVYGINLEKMNCDKLFNLFCLYGNVVKVFKMLSFLVDIDKSTSDIMSSTISNWIDI